MKREEATALSEHAMSVQNNFKAEKRVELRKHLTSIRNFCDYSPGNCLFSHCAERNSKLSRQSLNRRISCRC